MNKDQLIKEVAKRVNMTQALAEEAVNAVRDIIVEQIQAAGEFHLRGLGGFKVVERQARTGHNPQTGEPIQIPARNVVKFKPAAPLRDNIKIQRAPTSPPPPRR